MPAALGEKVGALERDAGEMRDGGDAKVGVDHLSDLGGGPVVARSTGGIGDADEVGVKLREGARDLAGALERHLALGRKHLKRYGLRASGFCLFKDLVDSH